MNRMTQLGHMTRDPELRYLNSGTPICDFTVATNRKWKTESGEEREDVLFLDWTAFGKTAEVISKHFKKGRQMLVEGRLKLDKWEDKQSGEQRSRIKATVDAFHFVGGKPEGTTAAQPRTARPMAPTTPKGGKIDDDDDNPPF